MPRRLAELQHRSAVSHSGIAHVGFPAIVRKFSVQSAHNIVAERFGQDASCGDAEVGGVALDAAGMAHRVWAKQVSIHQ